MGGLKTMTVWHVTRDVSGNITGMYSNPRVEEDGTVLTDPTPLADDHPDIVARMNELEAMLNAPAFIPKLIIVERLEAAGIRAAAKTALAADDLQQDRWDAATEIDPNDPAVIQILTSIGADLGVILAPV